jgi:hypothetical protein
MQSAFSRPVSCPQKAIGTQEWVSEVQNRYSGTANRQRVSFVEISCRMPAMGYVSSRQHWSRMFVELLASENPRMQLNRCGLQISWIRK